MKLSFLAERNQKAGIRLGLETMKLLLEQMGNPQDKLKFVHIAGTNGKGSVLRFTASILREAGYRVGAYSSPCVFREWEKISVDGRDIPETEAAEGLAVVKAAEQRIWGTEEENGNDNTDECCSGRNRAADGNDDFPHRPTGFELETALAFWYFARCECDMVVLETGLGGDEDATNIIAPPMCAALTSISLDHTKILGDTLTEIAGHKAGIIKPGTGAVVTTANQTDEVLEVLRSRCGETDTRLIQAAKSLQDISKEYVLSMEASYQQENAAIAYEVIQALRKQGMNIGEDALKRGFQNAVWHGRFEKISDTPPVYLDGAHNESAGIALAQTARKTFGDRKPILIMGVMADKAYEKLLGTMLPLSGGLYTVTPDNPRALDAEILAVSARKIADEQLFQDIPVRACATVEDAVHLALQDGIEKNCGVLCFGSLYYLGEARKCVHREIIGCI